jgi:hypothetical protein
LNRKTIISVTDVSLENHQVGWLYVHYIYYCITLVYYTYITVKKYSEYNIINLTNDGMMSKLLATHLLSFGYNKNLYAFKI